MAKTILAVDDSGSLRQMVVFSLRAAGYQVTEAVDGQDGLDKAKSHVFDLVLTDVGAASDSIPVEIDNQEMAVLLDKIAETMKSQSTMLENELWKAVCQTHMESGDIELF